MSKSLTAKARIGGRALGATAVVLALGLLSAAPASAEWRDHRHCCWGPRVGVVVAPPVVYGAAPVYVAPPPPPVYYAPPPPVVYAPPILSLGVNIR